MQSVLVKFLFTVPSFRYPMKMMGVFSAETSILNIEMRSCNNCGNFPLFIRPERLLKIDQILRLGFCVNLARFGNVQPIGLPKQINLNLVTYRLTFFFSLLQAKFM